MMNGTTPSVATLQADLDRAQQLINILRQQRDQAVSAANDLQVEMVMMRQKAEKDEADRIAPAAGQLGDLGQAEIN